MKRIVGNLADTGFHVAADDLACMNGWYPRI
jgi:hypothetical protein